MRILSGSAACLALCFTVSAFAAEPFDDKFRQLEELLPTPNTYRTASGAPGHAYWQQRADYTIRATLDEAKREITGSGTVTYHNKSPDTLGYLWVQLDQNIYKPDSDARRMATAPSRQAWAKTAGEDTMKFEGLRGILARGDFQGGFNIRALKGADGQPLKHVINRTMMRIDLPQPLKPGQDFVFQIDWDYRINEQKVLGGRAGYEYFAEDKNALFEVAQWFPRMAAYYDAAGWQHKQFLGSGEFTLEFGDYDVQLTVPADHVVASTGELQNPQDVLTPAQRERLEKARSSDKPVIIVTQKEAEAAEKSVSRAQKTWHFKAANVRDFAWASSRKFIWDAQGYKKGGSDVMAMSYYPKEGNPLWEKYSTQAIVHTIEQYNKYSIDYPYPTAISVNGPVGGMEYPMISFNGPRPVKDKKTGELTYSKRTKYGLIGVIIHEVGHNYYPMIINSDERQWTWMDEGLNTFVQYLAQQAWEENYPASRGEPREIVDYMRSRDQVPIMTNSESLAAVRQQRLRQAGGRPEHPARNHSGPRTVRLRLQGICAALEVQAPHAGRLFPHHGRRFRHGSRLVLARLVLHHRCGRHQHRRHQRIWREQQKPGNRKSLEKGAEGGPAGIRYRPRQQGHAAPGRRASGAEGFL